MAGTSQQTPNRDEIVFDTLMQRYYNVSLAEAYRIQEAASGHRSQVVHLCHVILDGLLDLMRGKITQLEIPASLPVQTPSSGPTGVKS